MPVSICRFAIAGSDGVITRYCFPSAWAPVPSISNSVLIRRRGLQIVGLWPGNFESQRRHFPRGLRSRIQRVTRARDRIVDENGVWLSAARPRADRFERLLASGASLAVAVDPRGGSVNDPVAISQSLRAFGDGLGRIGRALDQQAAELISVARKT